MEMDMTQNTNLTQDEMIVEHIGLLKKNGMQDKANDLFETYAYVDMLERKLNEYMGKKLHFMFGNRTLTYVSTEGELAVKEFASRDRRDR